MKASMSVEMPSCRDLQQMKRAGNLLFSAFHQLVKHDLLGAVHDQGDQFPLFVDDFQVFYESLNVKEVVCGRGTISCRRSDSLSRRSLDRRKLVCSGGEDSRDVGSIGL